MIYFTISETDFFDEDVEVRYLFHCDKSFIDDLDLFRDLFQEVTEQEIAFIFFDRKLGKNPPRINLKDYLKTYKQKLIDIPDRTMFSKMVKKLKKFAQSVTFAMSPLEYYILQNDFEKYIDHAKTENEKLKKVNDKIDKAISLIKVEVKNG